MEVFTSVQTTSIDHIMTQTIQDKELEVLLEPSPSHSISDIKSKTGLSSVHISRVLSGKATPSLPVARKIASALGISIEELDSYIESRPSIVYNGGKKIIDEDVMDKIRQCKGTMSCRRASVMFGVSRTTISNIWKSIQDNNRIEKGEI